MTRLPRIIVLLVLLPLTLAAFLLKERIPFLLKSSSELVPSTQVFLPYEELEPEEYEVYAVLHVIGECTVTYYDPCVLCCGKSDGITASGVRATPYETCAVDPAVIPLGSTVMVIYDDGEVRTYRAEDTGSGVKGNHIDVCVAGHREAKALGVRHGIVYWEEITAK